MWWRRPLFVTQAAFALNAARRNLIATLTLTFPNRESITLILTLTPVGGSW